MKDTGIGLSKDQMTEMYEPLYRATPSYEAIYKGAGTGLTIVKRYVSDLDGQIACKSELGEGSTFIIAIPFKRSIISTYQLNN